MHIEDEPDAVFAQIVAAGLVPGMRVRLLERTPQRLRIAADTEEMVLAPVVAANVTVLPVEQPVPAERDDPAVGDRARRGGGSRGPGRDLPRRAAPPPARSGVVPGTRVASELRGPSGDPRRIASAARSSPCGASRRTTSSCTA